MILRVLDSSTTKTVNSVQHIKATYDPAKHTTTICFDTDIVTLGIVARFLATEYDSRKNELDCDLIVQLDDAINQAICDLDIERGR